MIIQITSELSKQILLKNGVSNEIMDWILAHQNDLSTQARTPLAKNIIENSCKRFNSAIFDLSNAKLLNKNIKEIENALKKEIEFMEDVFNDPYLYSKNPDPNQNAWKEIINKNEDIDITNIAKDMERLEQSITDTIQYTNDSYLQAKENLRDANELNKIYQQDKNELLSFVNNILQQEDNIEPFSEIKSLQKTLQDTIEKDTFKKEDFSKIIDLLQKDIDTQQQILTFLQEDYLKKSSFTLKGCIDILTDKIKGVQEHILKIKKDSIKFCKNACVIAAGNLTNASYKASELYWDIKNKVSEINQKLTYSLACFLEKSTLGEFSDFMQQLQTQNARINTAKETNMNFNNEPIYLKYNGKKFDYSFITKEDKFVHALMKHSKINYFLLEKDCWQDKSPYHKLEEKREQQREKIKESIENLIDNATNHVEKTISDIKELPERFSNFTNNMHNKILNTEADILNTFSQNIVNLADKQRQKAEKYKKIDKTIFEAETKIEKAIHSLNAITPYKEKQYKLTPIMAEQLKLLEDINSNNLPQKALTLMHDIDGFSEQTIEKFKLIDNLLNQDSVNNEQIIDIDSKDVVITDVTEDLEIVD